MKPNQLDSQKKALAGLRLRGNRSSMRQMLSGLALASGLMAAAWSLGATPDFLPGKSVQAATKPKAKTNNADEDTGQKFDGHQSVAQAAGEKHIKLNYISASWPRVLQDVTESAEMELVTDRMPTGRFARRDKNEYTLREAIRILNTELEPQGLRLVEKGSYLVMNRIPETRKEYPRPVLPAKQRPVEDDPNSMARTTQFRAESISKSSKKDPDPAVQQIDVADKSIRYNVPKSRQPNSEIELATENSNSPRNVAGNRAIRQAALQDEAEQEAAPPRRPHPIEASAPAGLDDVGAPAPYLTYKARHVSAVDLSKRIYKGLKTSAELVDSGRNGLPAFKVERLSASTDRKASRDQDVGFMISIDDARNELLIDGTQKDISAVNKLLKVLDRPDGDDLKTQIKPSTKYVCQMADQLPAEIDRLRAARGSDAVARRPVDGKPAWLADENQRRVPVAEDDDAPRRDDAVRREQGARRDDVAQQPNRSVAQGDPQQAIGYSLGSFKGEVNIEVIDDLNVMIIRGNERDVEQIMKVIQQIEKLSLETAPEVHLRYLKNVDSDSLAELLTSVYDRLRLFPGKATQPRQSAAIIPVNKPNALLIVAPKSDAEAILSLVDDLDQAVDPETEFEVIPLKYAVSTEVESAISNFYQNRASLGVRVLAIADPRSNSIIVRAQPRDLEEIRALIHKLDRDDAGPKVEARVFVLKNAVATELSQVINVAIQSVLAPPSSSPSGGGGQGGLGANLGLQGAQVDEQFKTTKGTILQFFAKDKDGLRKLQSGILSDIRITPDAHANSLIVTASEKSMDLVEALIKALDRPTSTVSEIKVFTLANADATQMVQQLNALFNNQPQGGNQQQQQQRQLLGIALANADDASSSLVPLKFSVDTRTNSVIAVGSADALSVVQAIMYRLDESNLRARQNMVIRLNNAPVLQIATAVTQFFQQQRDLTQADPNLVSNVEQLEREVIVIPDQISNNLLVSASPRYFPTIEAMIKQLDAVPKQVVIQALIVEVALNNTDEFGVELGLQSPVLFDRSLKQTPVVQTLTNTSTGGSLQTTTQTLLSQEGTPGFNFNNPGVPLGNNILSGAGTVGGQSLTNFSVGRTNGQLGYGGLVLSAGSNSVNALLRALSAKTKIQILSRPQIRALDSQLAEVFVGQTIPTVTSFTTNATTGVISPNLTQRDTGIGLQVTPRINLDGNVVIQMYAYRSQLSQQTVNVTTDSRGQPVGQRITDLSNVRSTVLVPANSTIVIGGMISTRDEVSNRKAPFLGDIPVLGQLFRYDSRTSTRTELLIFLTPRIINGPEDEECFKEIEMGRMHFIESEAEEAHGPLRAVQPGDVFENDPTPWVGPGSTPGSTPSLPNPPPPSPIQATPPRLQGPGTGIPPAPPAASPPVSVPPATLQQSVPATIPAGNDSTPMNVPPAPPLPDPNITRINAVRAASMEGANSKKKVSTANWLSPAASKKRAANSQRIFEEEQQNQLLNQTQQKN